MPYKSMVGAVFTLATLLGQAQAVTPPKPVGDSRAAELVRRYNLRDTGSPGWRRVSVVFQSKGRNTRAYTISNFWSSHQDTARMLFYLEDPVGLRRTRYLQIEDQAAAQELGVYLFLPAGGRQVMTIAPGSHGEGLLGSDFSYNDLRLKLPVHACNYRFLGSDVLDGRRVWKIEALQSRPELPWNRAILYLAQDRPFLLGADYYSHAVGQPDATVKIMRVQKFRDIGPVRTAVRMTMSARDGNSTIILLQDTRLGIRGISPAWLEPATLGSPALDGDPFRQMGWGAMAK